MLRRHAQPDQLRPLGHRQPGVEPALRRCRRVHRPGLDRHGAHAQRLRGRPPRADLRDRVPGVWRDGRGHPGQPGRLWFLHDPVEDDPNHSWEDYRTNWECTVVASLFWPETARYEVAPWPERVFHGRYPTVDRSHRKPGEPVDREPIPPAYATELLTVMNALNDMDQPDVAWEHCGTRGIGIVVSDSMMFQRERTQPSDPHLGSFFGLALPLLERGMPVEPVQLETATIPGNLARCKVLVMTYEGMKPMDRAAQPGDRRLGQGGGLPGVRR